MALMDGLVVITKRFAQGKGTRACQGAAGHGADKGDEFRYLPCRLSDQQTQTQRAGQLQEASARQWLAVELCQVINHSRLNAGENEQIEPRNGNGPGRGSQRAVTGYVRQCPAREQFLQ